MTIGPNGATPPARLPTAAQHWSHALAQWAIPDDILAQAPAPPWDFPPELFARTARRALADGSFSASRRRAAYALPESGSVLDVGAGGGAASLPLAPPAGLLTAVDESREMLAVFASVAERRGVTHQEVYGKWPDVAPEVAAADVVVCHNVAYNVADLVPFVAALTDHARCRVVLELTEEHPTAHLNPLWLALHGVVRPTTPTADDALALLSEMGIAAHCERFVRQWPQPGANRAETVAFIRRRLCVGPERDAEIDTLLEPGAEVPVRHLVTIWWAGSA